MDLEAVGLVEPKAGPIAEPFEPAGSTVPLGRWLMAAVLVALNLLDLVLTKAILARGGSETNPLLQPVIHDPLTPVLVKLGVAVLVGVLLLASPRSSKLADRAMLATVVLYALVIAWNAGLLLHGAV